MQPAETPSCEVAIQSQLLALEPLFHRFDAGATRIDLERLMAPEFFEIGASGKRYSRAFILETLEARYIDGAPRETWHIDLVECWRLAVDVYRLTYRLDFAARRTWRTTLWTRREGRWQAVFHQGTVIV